MGRIWINPIYLIIPPVLLTISLPLAIFATVTTILALTTLLIRVIIVYFDVGILLLTKGVFTSYKDIPPTAPQTPLTEHFEHQLEKAKRRQSNASRRSPVSQSSSPSANDIRFFRNSARSDSYASLLGIGIPNRDYEGVGGWRLRNMAPEDDGSDDAMWKNMNSRLELPLGTPLLVTAGISGGTGLRHKRSLTGSSGRLSFSNGEAMRMSPVASRTPLATQQDDDLGYFAANPAGRSNVSRRRSMGMMTANPYPNGKRNKKGSVESFDQITNNGK